MILVFFFFLIPSEALFHAGHCVASRRPDWMCTYMKLNHREYESEDAFRKVEDNLRRSYMILSRHSIDNVSFVLSDERFVPNHHLRKPYRLGSSKGLSSVHRLMSLRRNRGRFDWRRYRGAVTPIKNQGNCGSCYTFAASAVLEFWANRRRHRGHSLSPQILLDCTLRPLGENYGCEGGWVEEIFDYAKDHAVGSWLSFPYKAVNTSCPTTPIPSKVQVFSYRGLSTASDALAEKRLAYIVRRFGPVAVGIDVGTTELLFYYNGGIFPGDACGKSIDHAVTIVGYTPKYWIIKNSWGKKWGVKGYLYLERGVNACGVANYINFITNAKPLRNELKSCI